jgi:hypothetical protein
VGQSEGQERSIYCWKLNNAAISCQPSAVS